MSSPVDIADIDKEMSKIMDPELGRSIADLRLIDKVTVEGGRVDVEFHLTAPFCPPVFAFKIASDIRAGLLSVRGVTDAKVTLKGHYMADAVNRQVNGPSEP